MSPHPQNVSPRHVLPPLGLQGQRLRAVLGTRLGLSLFDCAMMWMCLPGLEVHDMMGQRAYFWAWQMVGRALSKVHEFSAGRIQQRKS